MGKKSKKTRWRALALNGHQSDSEESCTKSSLHTSKDYQQKYPKFPYSSQSTPIKKFQHESSKSTRSNSTTSDHKTTFNEDEYTRITTPRQDVLFKKGYLNKPKTYQTQTSTGTSSTANSTATCTPDHQSADGTDLEYESLVFPNAFIDQNGVYYINSLEPFPFVVYNPPICYPEYPTGRSKRYSTDSLVESVSPQDEETSLEYPQNGVGESVSNYTPIITHNYVHLNGYYCSNGSSNHNGQYTFAEQRKVKKKRRRKVSRSKMPNEDLTSDGSDSCCSSDELFNRLESKINGISTCTLSTNHTLNGTPTQEETQPDQPSDNETETYQNCFDTLQNSTNLNCPKQDCSTETSIITETDDSEDSAEKSAPISIENKIESTEQTKQELENETGLSDAQNQLLQSLLKSPKSKSSNVDEPNSIPDLPEDCINGDPPESSLKPDAKEFIPRTFRQPETLPLYPHVQFLNMPSGFIPVPFINHVGEMQRSVPFLPPGIPLSFISSEDMKIIPSFVNIAPAKPEIIEESSIEITDKSIKLEQCENRQNEVNTKPKTVEQVIAQPKSDIDIARIVSNLEDAAKQQRFPKRQGYNNRNGGNKFNTSRSYQNYKGKYINNYHQKTYERKHKPFAIKWKHTDDVNDKLDSQKLINTVSIAENKSPDVMVVPQQERNGTEKEKQDRVNIANISDNENCSNKNINLKYNYSETLKKVNAKPVTPKKYKTIVPNIEKTERSNEKINQDVTTNGYTSPVKLQKKMNQWISVSSKKKRKNKHNEEQDFETEDLSVDDCFHESQNASLLVDVITEPSITCSETKENVENILDEENGNTVVFVPQPEPVIAALKINKKSSSDTSYPSKLIKDKKKKKKHNEKRLFITDSDLKLDLPNVVNQNNEDLKEADIVKESALDKTVTKDDNDFKPILETNNNICINETNTADKLMDNISPIIEPVKTTPEKKVKKKKKKLNKSLSIEKIVNSSNTNTVLSNNEESYNFLLESTVFEDMEEKTNVDISQDLDRMIQKGIYNSLEEKIRVMKLTNIDDRFFKMLDSNFYIPKKSTNLPSPFNIGNDFKNTSGLLKGSRQIHKSNEENPIDFDVLKMNLPDLEQQPSTSKQGIFLENPEVAKILSNISQDCVNETQDIKTLDYIRVNDEKEEETELAFIKGEQQNATIEQDLQNLTTTSTIFSSQLVRQDGLYPITQAVKEWMIKTRENTPDIELLKSPNTIYKEFHKTKVETTLDHLHAPLTKSQLQQSLSSNHTIENTDDEITLWSISPQHSIEEDLINCWEDEQAPDFSHSNSKLESKPDEEINSSTQNDCTPAIVCIEKGEEAIERYESKYGNNEDFLQIKTEIEQHCRNVSFSRHGDLPYRAICCSIM